MNMEDIIQFQQLFVITLLDFQNLNLTSCITFCDIFNTNDMAFKQKYWKNWFFRDYFGKWLNITWKCENCKWPLVCSSPYISASTWPKIKSKDSFEKLRTSTFQNWPYFLNLVKIWWKYCQKQHKKKFSVTPFISSHVRIIFSIYIGHKIKILSALCLSASPLTTLLPQKFWAWMLMLFVCVWHDSFQICWIFVT